MGAHFAQILVKVHNLGLKVCPSAEYWRSEARSAEISMKVPKRGNKFALSGEVCKMGRILYRFR